jgi:hypothetical protein
LLWLVTAEAFALAGSNNESSNRHKNPFALSLSKGCL